MDRAGFRETPVSPAAVGLRRQLFLDDTLLSRREGLRRRLHPARREPAPVLRPDRPWEGRRVYNYGSVRRDPATGLWRMWYLARMGYGQDRRVPGADRHGDMILYAESEDGLAWRKPDVGTVPFDGDARNNIVLPGCHGSSLVLDAEAEGPERHRMVAWSWNDRRYRTYRSPDGLGWEACPDVAPIRDGQEVVSVSRHPDSLEYHAFHRVMDRGQDPPRRLIAASRSADLLRWGAPQTVLAPDSRDGAEGLGSEFYDLSGFWYESLFIGLLPVFRVLSYRPEARRDGADVSPWDGPIEAQLAFSRDGLRWERFEDRSPIVARGEDGSFDAGCILGLADAPVAFRDRLWMYYTAVNTTHGGPMPPKEITIGLASWRLDGFVSLEAGGEGGFLDTVPLQAGGPLLEVNVEAPDGCLEAELLSPDGSVLPGYARQDCVPVRGDLARAEVRWKDRSGVDPARPLRLRLHLKNGRLYSFGFKGKA